MPIQPTTKWKDSTYILKLLFSLIINIEKVGCSFKYYLFFPIFIFLSLVGTIVRVTSDELRTNEMKFLDWSDKGFSNSLSKIDYYYK